MARNPQAIRCNIQILVEVLSNQWCRLLSSQYSGDPHIPAESLGQFQLFIWNDQFPSSGSFLNLNVRFRGNELLKRFMKGVAKLRPQKPRCNFIWDPEQVLDYFESHHPTSLKELSMKLVTLLLLATGQRLQTISLIKLSNIIPQEQGVQILINDSIKTSGVNVNAPHLVIPRFGDKPKLCLLTCLQKYIVDTETFRGSVDYLFITVQRPHHQASKQTLTRLVK